MSATNRVTEVKWTPGPWTLPHFAEPDVNCRCNYVLCDGLMGAVASVLIDICQRIEEWESAVRKVIGGREVKHGMDLTKAKAALAKAGAV